MDRWVNRIHAGHVLDTLRRIPDECVQMSVTSPPYYGLRDYGTAEWEGGSPECSHTYPVKSPLNEGFNERCGNSPGLKKQESWRHEIAFRNICGKCGAVRIDNQIGLESTIEEYVFKMVEVFREVWRVLKKDGTLWLNLGDSYAANRSYQVADNKHCDVGNHSASSIPSGLKAKDMLGIPWRIAFALQADGWYLRQDIIWHKPNPMPESVTDRCTKSHEYLFLLSKSERYFFDQEAIREPHQSQGKVRYPDQESYASKGRLTPLSSKPRLFYGDNGRNKRSVWTIATEAFSEAHFATFPQKLIEPCILAGSRMDDIVIDPFMGSGTTAVVARKLGRKYIGCELNPEYIEMAEKRIKRECSQSNLFHEIERAKARSI